MIREQVSNAILVPFITDGPLVRHAVAPENPLMLSKKPGNWLTVGIGDLFRKHLQSFFHSDGVFFSKNIGGRKGENCLSSQYLAGNLKGNSAIRWDFHCLRNRHGENIA